MDSFYIIIGSFAIYSWIHFAVFSWQTPYEKRTEYQKFVTWFTMISFVLFFIGAIGI